MKKVVYTLCVDNYFPELSALTIPNHAEYAKKIGADFQIISERKFPEWPATYEKTQIWEIGKDNDWSIHIDADMLVHPAMWDVTTTDLSTVKYYSIYDPRPYFKPNIYFLRDARLLGICSSFMAVPSWCHEIWQPFAYSFEEARKGVERVHGIDDYCFSINFAKYGLKGDFIFKEGDPLNYLEHLCVGGGVGEDLKGKLISKAQTILESWSA